MNINFSCLQIEKNFIENNQRKNDLVEDEEMIKIPALNLKSQESSSLENREITHLNPSSNQLEGLSKEALLEKIFAEERHALKYISVDEIDEIIASLNSELIPDMVSKIKLAQWEGFLDSYGSNKNTTYILLAAFCLETITSDELATAILFSRSYSDFKKTVTCIGGGKNNTTRVEKVHAEVVPYDPEYYNLFHEYEKSKSIEEITQYLSDIPVNQRFILLVKLSAFDPYTLGLIKGSFKNFNTMGVRLYNFEEKGECIGVASFGLAKHFYSEFSKNSKNVPLQELTLSLGMTPTLQEMASNILKGNSDTMILTPNNKPCVHGSTNFLWTYIHDLLHATARAKLGDRLHNLVQFGSLMDTVLAKVDYSAKLKNSFRRVDPEFKKMPDHAEVVQFVWDRISSDLVDGAWTLDPCISNREFLDLTVYNVTRKVSLSLNQKFNIQLGFNFESQVRDRLNIIWEKYPLLNSSKPLKLVDNE